jgi:VanZ family protein
MTDTRLDQAKEQTLDSQRRTARRRWILVAFIMLTIFAASSIPESKKPPGPIKQTDKLQHFIAYGVLAVTLYRALRVSKPDRSGAFFIVATIVIASAYGGLDEFHQRFTPGRTMSILDWRADVIGAFAAAILMQLTYTIGGRKQWLKNKDSKS